MQENTHYKTIIASAYQKKSIFQNLLKENKNGMIKIQILSYNTFFNQDESISNTHVFLQYYKTCTALKDQLSVFKSLVFSYGFIEEIISFVRIMDEYHIQPSDLPHTTQKEIELKLLVEAVYLIPTNTKTKVKQIQQLQNQDLSYVTIYQDAYASISQKNTIQTMIQNNATYIPLNKPTLASIKAFQAANTRYEVESLAQYLISNADDLSNYQIILSDTSVYTELIKQVFSRYEIPYQFMYQTSTTKIQYVYLAYLACLTQKDIASFLTLIQYQCFDFNCARFYQYTSQYDITLLECLHPFNKVATLSDTLFSNKDIEELLKLEQDAEQTRLLLLPFIESIFNEKTSKDILKESFDLCLTHLFLKSEFEQKALEKVRVFINDLYNETDSILDIPSFLTYLFKSIQVDQTDSSQNGIKIATLSTCYTSDLHTNIILGGNHNAFIKPKIHTGIFDESYMKQLAYPSIEERTTFTLDQTMELLSFAKNLIISYTYGDLNGKPKEIAFELEQWLEAQNIKIQEWPIVSNDLAKTQKEHISPTTSKELFLKDNTIFGSVSSIETYFNCKYSYFLKYGFKLYSKRKIVLDSALLGTILHKIIEVLVLNKKYPRVSKEDLTQTIDVVFKDIYKLFSNKKDQLDLIKLRIHNNLSLTLEFLTSMESTTSFKTDKLEYPFTHTFEFDKASLVLRGVVDRIDTYSDYFRIIDYKSSMKTLSEKNFFLGTQLQLLTYLYVITQQLNKKPTGAYYATLKTSNTPIKAYTYDLRKKEETYFDSEKKHQLFIESQKLSGATVLFTPELDTTAKHVKGIRLGKNGPAVSGKAYNFELIEQALLDVYEQFTQLLLSGNIACDPKEYACTFCEFKAICQNTAVYKANPLTDIETLKDGDNDGN